MSLRVYSAAEVHAALPWAALAQALADAFVAGDTQVPLRHAHALGDGASLLLMPAWSAGALGVKLVTVMPQAAAQGLPHGAGQLPAQRRARAACRWRCSMATR